MLFSHSEQSVPVLLDLINSFAEVSGRTINWEKSEFLSFGADFDPSFLNWN